MSWKLVGSVIVMTLCLAVSFVRGEPRGGGGEKSRGENSNKEKSEAEKSSGAKSTGKKPPGGNWSEYNHQGQQGKEQAGNAQNKSGAEGAAAGHAAEKNKNSQPTGAEGAAAGAAAANRNQPAASGAQGAAAGAAAANRNSPQYSGAQGAAAGAAAANRNQPAVSGAAGAAAGYAAGNNNNPQFSGAQGAAAGAAAANRNQPATSGAEGAAAGYAAVRNNVDHPGIYGQQWYGEHQSAWSAPGWVENAAWVHEPWDTVAGHCGYTNVTPSPYDYGNNVTCIGGNVVVNGQSVGTAEQFSEEAAAIAEAGTTAATSATDQWMPLGVFALVRNEQQHPQLIMQLAVNQQGVLRGNYTDEVTDSTLPIHGEVDKQSGRAAWTVGDNRYSVMEAGLNNLTQSEAPALIHKNGSTQRWLLVRLAQPSQ